MATYITGDIHGDISRIIAFRQRMKLNKNDNIIICGDAGICWRKDKRDLEYIISLWDECGNGTKLYFLDGNHENFAILDSLPIENNMGKVSDNIFHLLRGQTYNFENKKVLVCGGADSIDWYLRTKNFTWWEEETISAEDIAGISASHYDYVLTHCCPRSIFENNRVYLITLREIQQDKINHNSEDKLEELKNKITFDNWLFGHYHIDMTFENGFRCLFNDFIELK